MAAFILSEKAEKDIVEIWAYVAADDVDAADRFVDTVTGKLTKLTETPYIGRLRNDLGKDLRSLPFGDYVIIYRPVEVGIEVVRVVHGARNLTGLF